MISVGGVIYAWLGHPGSASFTSNTNPIKSTDYCRTWSSPGWSWHSGDNLYGPSFLNFGKDNAGARDNYVYSYFPRGSSWGLHNNADLARVPKDQIMVQGAYEWFAGFESDGTTPKWTSLMTSRQPVYTHSNGVRTISCTYNPGLKRYLLTAQHTTTGTGSGSSKWGLYEGKEPWGPWKTVYYTNRFSDGNGAEIQGVISFYFAPKWFSTDGRDFTMVLTWDDYWGTIRGRFTVQALDNTLPTAPTNLAATVLSESEINLCWNAAQDPETGVSKYLIYRGNVKVGETDSLCYNDGGLAENASYSYQVSAFNGADMEGPKSNTAGATTQADTRPPALSSVSAEDVNKISVVFSEKVESGSAQNIQNYSIDNNIAVSSAVLGADERTVVLTTNNHAENITYTLTVNNVIDQAASPNTIAAGSQLSYTYSGRLTVSNIQVQSQAAYVAESFESPYAGKLIYVDRSYAFTDPDQNVSSSLQDGLYVKTANDDKSAGGGSFLSFEINLPGIVYVGVAGSSPLSWMSGWDATGITLHGSHGVTYTFYSKEFPKGTVTLGGNEGSGANMYTVIVKKESGTLIRRGSQDNKISENVIRVTPNPFNASTTIRLIRGRKPRAGGARGQHVNIQIYNTHGQMVDRLTSDLQSLAAGFSWKASRYPAGIYWVAVRLGNKVVTKKITLLK
jgi:hypothetical protein